MKLDAFFQRIAPMLEGRLPPEAGAAELFGPEPRQPDARRLAIYARFCKVHRHEALESTFAYTHQALLARAGEAAWAELVDAHFRAHPMRHFELNENGASFPEWLPGQLEARALPAWLGELADLEWWEWRTRIAPDAEADRAPEAGPVRLASTVELRPYRCDLVAWVDEAGREGEPEAGERLVLFWRDADLDVRRENAEPAELALLKCVAEGLPVGQAGLPPALRDETLADLRDAGILLGR